ncbi:MAG: S41 family peptidase [Actinomycetia bacterium]|nr:S41 family peptidase [Actinomycetes bacterium]
MPRLGVHAQPMSPPAPLPALPPEQPPTEQLPTRPLEVRLGVVETALPVVQPRTDPGASPLSVVDQVRVALQTSYYLPVSDDVLSQPFVFQIIEALGDPYTDYLSAAEYEELRSEINSTTYPGVGLLVGPSDRGLTVTSALKGPARKAGVRPGDIILAVDGKGVQELPFERAISLFRGEQGTVVRLTITRPDERRKWRVEVTRKEIELPPIRARLHESDRGIIGYLRVLSFSRGVGDQLRDAVGQLLDEGAQGFVLDLRGNPGGLLDEAIDVASAFLERGVVLTTSSSHGTEQVYEAAGNAIAAEVPVVVLVDSLSASAAEIVAAALADNFSATVVGQQTFGKASVQSLVPLSNGDALRLTTSSYVTPTGAHIAGRGIEPSIEARDDFTTKRDEGLRAAKKALFDIIDQRARPDAVAF